MQEEYNPQRIEQSIRLQGQQIDAETGLHYNRFRYYDPHLGQYITQDPIDLNGGGNLYLYTNQPITMIDPLGLETNIVGHPAAGPVGKLTNPNSHHLAIELKPDDANCDLAGVKTLGGQPSGNFANGYLVSRSNYPGDSKGIDVRQAIQKPEGMTDCEFLKKLKKASEEYCNCLPYSKPNVSLIPGAQDGQMDPGTYNSNSYVSGVIQRAGAVPPTLNTGGNWQAPGYGNPLPISNIVAPVGTVEVK
ncbi:RHS repeat-associated core domain-containing protein [Acidovorax sp. SUPP1855]|uniref:RHS repeat-associated core domain-containing protein n=1 Tax=Acidovorax sp. SUPP1855 TaxID=431774 RepID=UPI0023DE1AE8|nr:RHS repeat-associated core domain-containing protein [Acidovorax sp. SUPP1855]